MKKNEKNLFPIEGMEKKIGYSFGNKDLLVQAFTRSSFAAERIGVADNEILEFIGDSVIGMLVVKRLSARYELIETASAEGKRNYECELDEAELSKLKIEMVKRSTLAATTEKFGFEKYLFMGKSDVIGNVEDQESVKEDLLEAIVGAVAIDSSWDMSSLEGVVKNLLDVDGILENGTKGEPNYEALLAEWFEARGKKLIFKKAPQVCKNLKCAVCVDLGADMLNYVAYGYANTEFGAKRFASKRAMEFIEKNQGMYDKVIKAIGIPDRNRAINQLQELYQKGIIPEPKYIFEMAGKGDNGNPNWECSCSIEGVYDSRGGYISSSKSEAKKAIAYDALNYLLGRDFVSTFMEFGEEKKIEKKETEK